MFSESAWATRRFIGAAVALAMFAGCATAPTPEAPAATPEPAVETAPPPAPAPPPPPPAPNPAVRLSIAAVGDMMLGTDYPENHLPDDDGVSFLAGVTPILQSADLTFGNLEGVLADEAEPAKKCSNLSACYLFRSPTRYARYLRDAGFDAMSLANNHARDFGEEGRDESMSALREFGIAHSGREGDYATLHSKGLRVSFIAFAVTRNSNLMHDYALAEQIVLEQSQLHDLVVVSFHGGAEGEGTTRIPFGEESYYGEPRGDVVRFARSMVDAGADLVFGHGPHVVRGMEHYRERLIAYSLGNFATYYGISVNGIKGVAPILVATLDQDGRFVEGQIHSTVQRRPGGPVMDDEQQALNLIRTLSLEDFREPGLQFHTDGSIRSVPRGRIRPTARPAVEQTESVD